MCCVLFHSVCNLNAVHRKIMFYKGHNAVEATKKTFVVRKVKAQLITLQ